MWMFDRVLCSRMEATSRPHVCWEALIDLHRLLEDSRPKEVPDTREDCFPPTMEGSDATSTGLNRPGFFGELIS